MASPNPTCWLTMVSPAGKAPNTATIVRSAPVIIPPMGQMRLDCPKLIFYSGAAQEYLLRFVELPLRLRENPERVGSPDVARRIVQGARCGPGRR